MKIKFNKPIDFSDRCLVLRPAKALQFKGSFALTSHNLRDFLATHPDFFGKFVFDKRTRNLALCAGDETPHHSVARSLTENISSEEMVGAELELKREGSNIKIELYGDSGFFGRPTKEEFNLVAKRLLELFNSIGVAASICLPEPA